MSIYFEFPDCVIGHKLGNWYGHTPIPAKYCVRSDFKHSGFKSLIPWKIIARADRVWTDENGQVEYLKNPNGSGKDSVDLKEFMFVKLAAVEI